MRTILLLITIVIFLMGPTQVVTACPSCQAALENLSETEDYAVEAEKQKNLSAAFNNSIYLMISVPYALLGIFGFLIYRGVRKHDAQQLAQLQQTEADQPKRDESPSA